MSATYNMGVTYSLALYLWTITLFKGLTEGLESIILKACEDEEEECIDIETSDACAKFGGIDCVFIRKIIHNDLELQSATVNAANCTMPGVTGDGTTFCKIKLAPGSTYSFNGAVNSGAVTLSTTGILEGDSPEITKTFNNIFKNCNWEMVISTNNCKLRYVGADFINGAFQDFSTALGAGIDQQGGTLDGDGPSNTLNWEATARCLPVYIDMTKADFEAAYT